jgi:hypothetical protein
MHGHGGCSLELQPTINRWDYVRYGTISYGEQMIASNPPCWFVDARVRALLDRFTVTYDQPNYVRVDETTVNVEGIERSRDQLLASRGTDTTVAPDLPHVTATRRRDNGPPHEVEIVLDKPIPFNATTRLILNDGVAVNVVEFTFAPGDTDGDGDADLADFSYLANCFGPTSPCPLLGKEGARCGPCLVLDMNSSGEVDAADYAVFFDLLVAP